MCEKIINIWFDWIRTYSWTEKSDGQGFLQSYNYTIITSAQMKVGKHIFLPINIIGTLGQWCLNSGYHFRKMLSNELLLLME